MIDRVLLRLSLSAGMMIYAAIGIVALAANVGLASSTLHRLGIGGPVYERVIRGKDLVADILPPPEYLVEAYLNVFLAKNGKIQSDSFARIRKDFDERRAYWRASELPDELKHQLIDVAGGEGEAFWAEVDQHYLPALKSGDSAAGDASLARLSEIYRRHREAIDRLVTMADAYADSEEATARADMPRFESIMAAVALLGFLVLGAGVYAVRRIVVRPIAEVTRKIKGLDIEAAMRMRAVKAQMDLAPCMEYLDNALRASGRPISVNGTLRYGPTALGPDPLVIAEIERKHGAFAAIFAGRAVIATNLRDTEGRPLTVDALMNETIRQSVLAGCSFQGEAKVGGRPFFAIYEPILEGNTVIGALFVGAPAAPEMRSEDPSATAPASEVLQMNAAADNLARSLDEHRRLDEAATAARLRGLDALRLAKALTEEAGTAQQEVVGNLSVALRQLASTDLSHRIVGAFPSDYVALKADFNAAVDVLGETVQGIREQTGSVEGLSQEIAQAARDLSLRTERQAANLAETASTLNEITSGLRRTADSAETSRQIIQDAQKDAEGSAEIVRQTIAAMQGIQTSSQEIGKIIGVIDDIALQTNLLALNAGVEAARAGPSGQGFAVVAAEVRALANRSTEAARDIKMLIESSGRQITGGAECVDRTGEALNRISERVRHVVGHIEDISIAAAAQATSLAEINTAVAQLDTMTQQNATMVEETTATSQHLAEQTRAISGMMARFRLAPKGQRARVA